MIPRKNGLQRLAATLVIALLLPAGPTWANPDDAPLGSQIEPGGGLPDLPGGERDCFCPQNYDPVVCEGGVVFPNSCVANCANAINCGRTDRRPAETPPTDADPGCFCAEIYQPVVCAGGVVFANSCFAACAKAENCHPVGDR